MANTLIYSRIDPHIKAEAMALFENLGLTLIEAVRLFVYKAVAEKRIPFAVDSPNAKTRQALKNADQGIGLESTSIEQLRNDWKNA